jgi:hypothetical protein
MTQARIDRAVARATGEDLSTIKRMGFSVVDPNQTDFDNEPAVPNMVDWDDLDEQRVVQFPVSLRRAA